MKIEKSRKGELTTKQIVTLIVLIVSFVIILFLIFRLNLGGTTDKEICHNSVVLRDQSKILAGPLDCRTNYVCISGGEDCTGITASEKIEVDPTSKEKIMKAIADEMASCWWQFGEDKELRYTGGPGATGVHCAVCSIVEFDKSVQEELLKIDYSEFYSYLEKTPKDGSQSYLRYMYGISDVDDLVFKTQTIVDIKKDIISTRDKYSIITGIDNNLLDVLEDDEWLKVYIIPTIETPATRCTEFITKA